MANKTRQNPSNLSRSLKVIVLLVFFIAALLAYSKINYQVKLSNERKRIKEVVANFKTVKSAIEKELGVTFEQKAGCTQSQGKSDGPDANWGCNIAIYDPKEEYYDKQNLINSTIMSTKIFDRMVIIEASSYGFYLSSDREGLPRCGAQYRSFRFGCSTGFHNENKEFAFKELGI